MATQLKLNKVRDQDLIRLAKKRVRLPDDWLEMDYSHEADVLFIRCSRNKPKRSKGDEEGGIVYDYDGRGNLVSIEVINLYGIFNSV